MSSNPILEYWQAINSGDVVVSQKVYKTYKHLVDKLENPTTYFYDNKRAERVINFFEKFCHHSKGAVGGQLVTLELWEKALLASVFGFVDIDGNRQYREAILIVGKKNGKSLLASGIGNYMLFADGEPGAEVYAVATKREQAKIIWLEAKRMVKKSPVLYKRAKCLQAEIDTDFNDGTFKPLASDSNTLDGLNIHCALMDEVHQWQHGRALYDIIADGVTAREQPLVLITSTAGVIREDIYDEKYDEATRIINGYGDADGYKDEHTICFVYELDKKEEWQYEEYWQKANPGLGTIKSKKILADKVAKAKQNPDLIKNLVCKEFNIRETSAEAWLPYEVIDNRDTYILDKAQKRFIWQHNGEERQLSYPRYGCGGVDLSSTTDLTAAKVIFCVPGCDNVFVKSMYWLADELLEKRVHEDKIPYDKWLDRGLVRLCKGNSINYHDVTEWFEEIQNEYDIYLPYIGYDAWSAKYFVEDMQGTFGGSMIAVQQGVKTLSDPLKRLGADFASKLIVYDNNPIDKWCLCNTAVKEDVNGNIQPCKTSSPTKRIDGTAALLDAYTVYRNNYSDYMNLI